MSSGSPSHTPNYGSASAPPAPVPPKETATLHRFWGSFDDEALERRYVHYTMVEQGHAPQFARFLALFALFSAMLVPQGILFTQSSAVQLSFAIAQALFFIVLAVYALLRPKKWAELLCTRIRVMRPLVFFMFSLGIAHTMAFHFEEARKDRVEFEDDEGRATCEEVSTMLSLTAFTVILFNIFALVDYVTPGFRVLYSGLLILGAWAFIVSILDILLATVTAVTGSFVFMAFLRQSYRSARDARLAFLLLERLKRENITVSLLFSGGSKVAPGIAAAQDETGSQDRRPAFIIDPAAIELGRSIGEGGFGTVYAGIWRGCEVAVKHLHDPSPEKAAELIREASFLLTLRHPNIVLFLGLALATDDDTVMLVTEYCALGSLIDVIQRAEEDPHSLPMHRRYSLLAQAAAGCRFLHHADPPIVHRDLKPANILVDQRFTAKVADFGTVQAQLQEEDEVGPKVGTALYSAPEVLRGKTFLPASDVYSFSVVMWQTLANEFVPFMDQINSGMSLAQIASSVVFGMRPPLAPLIENAVLRDVQALIELSWHHHPDSRPTFDDVQKRLEKAERESATTGSPRAAADRIMSHASSSVFSADYASGAMPGATLVVHNRHVRAIVEGRVKVSSVSSLSAFSRAVSAARAQQPGSHVVKSELETVVIRCSTQSAVPFAVQIIARLVEADLGATSVVGLLANESETDDMTRVCLDEQATNVDFLTDSVFAQLLAESGSVIEAARPQGKLAADPLPITRFVYSDPRAGGSPQKNAQLPQLLSTGTSASDMVEVGIAEADLSLGASRGTGALGPIFDGLLRGKQRVTVKRIEGVRGRTAVTLLEEAVTLRRIQHPHVVHVLGVARRDGHLLLVSDYVATTLKNLIDNQIRSVDRVDLVRQAIQGLAYVHMVLEGAHGLLSSGAIAVSEDLQSARISDFGVLRTSSDWAVQTRTSTSSPKYLAPELLQENASTVSLQSDVFACGIILIEAEDTKGPSHRQTWFEIAEERRRGLRPMIPPDMRARVRTAVLAATGEAGTRPTASELAKMLS